jgi:hypothetical protein
MVSKSGAERLRLVVALVGVYVGVVVATVLALAVMTAVGSPLATREAWVHAVVVVVFAVLLPLRLRSARRGSKGGLDALVTIAAVLLVVNLVEAFVLDLFPTWMRVEMVGIAVLMALLVVAGLRARR